MILEKEYLLGKKILIAGTGEAGRSQDNIIASKAKLNGPAGLAIDQNDNIYIAEIHNHRISKIDSKTKILTTVAGCGEGGFEGDGGLAVNAKLNGPEGVFVDKQGNIYIADTYNQRIRKVDGVTGIIQTIGGCGDIGYNGDNIPACKAMLNEPAGVVCDKLGNVYFNDYGNDRVRKIDTSGMISTYAGNGVKGYSGDGGPADKTQVNDVFGLAIDNNDNIFIMDSLNFAVRKVDAKTQLINTLISGDMKNPHAVEITEAGYLFVADTGNSRIISLNSKQNKAYLLAGYDDNQNTSDSVLRAHGLRMDSQNNLYYIDYLSHVLESIKVTFKD